MQEQYANIYGTEGKVDSLIHFHFNKNGSFKDFNNELRSNKDTKSSYNKLAVWFTEMRVKISNITSKWSSHNVNKGCYYRKYMKYKNKYLELKNKM